MKVYFMTGTDTEIGKTYATCLLCSYLKNKNFKVGALKPIESGIKENPFPDYIKIAKASGDKEKPIYTLSKPLAPLIAAKKDGITIDIEKIINFYLNDINLNQYDYYFIEGAGGLFVPITPELLYIDIIKYFNCEIILVARTNLGTVNHTLLSIEALEKRDLKLKGIILNEVIPTPEEMIKENVFMIEKYSSYKVLKIIPYNASLKDLGELNGI